MEKHHHSFLPLVLGLVAVFVGSNLIQPSPVAAQEPQASPRVIHMVGPVSMDQDLRSLPYVPPANPGYAHPVLHRFPYSQSQPQTQPQNPLPPIFAPLANMPAPSQNFLGISAATSGCGCLPPDPNGDVGRTQYIQAVNTSFQIYDKSTGATLSGPTTFNSLFAPLGTSTPCGNTKNQGDPVVFYDQIADRWVLSDFAFTVSIFGVPSAPFYQCIAVSKSGDPVHGGYWLYAFQVDSSNPSWLGDYPKFGQWLDAYYMSANMFSEPSGNFQGVKVYALNRAQMLNGTGAPTLTVVAFTVTSGLGNSYTLLPARFRFGAPPNGTPEYFAAIDSPSNSATILNTVHIWKFHVDFTTPANSTFGTGATHTPNANVTVANFTDAFTGSDTSASSLIIPQQGTSQNLDSLGDRLMMNLWYQNIGGAESLWATHTVNNSGATGVRWYQFNVTGGNIATTPVQQQTFTNNADGIYRWMPSLSLDDNGNMAIGYSASSSSIYPAILYAGRLRSDSLNTLAQGESTLVAGGGHQTNSSGRWGDYSAMSIDPVDGCTFWYTQEYYPTSGNAPWNTRIGSFKFPTNTGCNSPTAVTLSSIKPTVAATENPPLVTLQWATGSEVNTAGFNVYRSEQAAGPFKRINAALIPASGSALTGARYAYQDAAAARGRTYFYQLEDVELDGASVRHAPVAVSLPEAQPNRNAEVYSLIGALAFFGAGTFAARRLGSIKRRTGS